MEIRSEFATLAQRIVQIGGAPLQPLDLPAFESTGISTASALRTASETKGFAEIVREAAAANRVDPNLVDAIVVNESGFDPYATSSTGAKGLMQLMPGTAAALGVENPYDPAENIAGGTHYLRELLDRFGGDVRLAVAAYNAGPNAVERYGGVPPYAETRRYVERVLGNYARSHSAVADW